MQYEAQNYSVLYSDGTGCRCGNCVSSPHLHKYEVALLFPAMILFSFPILCVWRGRVEDLPAVRGTSVIELDIK
jgi:hypothetical protein